MSLPPTDRPTDDTRRERFQSEVWPEAAMLMRTAISMTPDSAEAEDLVQDTLLKAFKAINQLEPGTSPRSWLLTMLRRTWIDRWRRRERRPDGQAVDLDSVAELSTETSDSRVAGEHDDQWTDPQALLSRFADQEIINALHLLPEGNRWALLLVDVQSLSVDEAAKTLDVAPGTIKSRLHRGRAMLRDQLHDLATDRGWLKRHDKEVLKEGNPHD